MLRKDLVLTAHILFVLISGTCFSDINVSLRGTATSSSYLGGWIPGTGPESVIDGYDFTGYHSGNDPAGEWWEVELDDEYDLSYIRIYAESGHFSGNTIKVLNSSRGIIWSGQGGAVGEMIINNDETDFSGVKYIRVESALSGYIVLHEVQCFVEGQDPFLVEAGPDLIATVNDSIQLDAEVQNAAGEVTFEWTVFSMPHGENVALNKSASASSYMPGWIAGTGPESVVDGSDLTGAHTGNSSGEWWEVDLGAEYDLAEVSICSSSGHAYGDIVSVLDSGRSVIASSVFPLSNHDGLFLFNNGSAGFAEARYIRIEAGQLSSYVVLYEVKAFETAAERTAVNFEPNEYVARPQASFSPTGKYTLQVNANENTNTASDKLKVYVCPKGAGQINNINFTTVDPDAIAYGQSYNQTVLNNQHGIFMTYLKSRNAQYDSQDWRLMRSIDGGETFNVIYQEMAGTNAPVIETDTNGNIYLVRHNYPDSYAYLYIFRPNDNYTSHTSHLLPGGGGGAKFSMYYDKSRDRLYYFGANAHNFFIIDANGNIIHNAQLLTGGASANSHYPSLDMDENGILYSAWTTSPYNTDICWYWSIHFMRSLDGGWNWQNMSGTVLTLPIVSDETGQTNGIILSDEYEYNTWLWNFAAQDGKVHFCYRNTGVGRQHYVRYDIASGLEDLRHYPEFRGELISLASGDGFVATVPEEPGCLFWVSANFRGQICCLYSEDYGQNWYDHAMNPIIGNYYAKQGFRETVNGGVIGATFDQNTDEVIFFRVPGVNPSAVLNYYSYENGNLRASFSSTFGRPTHIRFALASGGYTDWFNYSENFNENIQWQPLAYQLKNRFDSLSQITPLKGANIADFNFSVPVNFEDFYILSDAWLSTSSSENWNSDCDISVSEDGIVNIHDLHVFIYNWLME